MGDVAMERRNRPRISKSFRVLVKGLDITGEPFDVSTVVENMSSTGVYLRLKREVEIGARLDLTIRLASAFIKEPAVAEIAVEAEVLRIEPCGDGAFVPVPSPTTTFDASIPQLFHTTE